MPEGTIPAGTPEGQAMEALVDILKSANTPDVWQAQNILLQRLALQGDVVGSRVPAPLNITEIGGYINLLETLEQPEMRAQALAGILGVAGPNPPLGWLASSPPLRMVLVANDRPDGPSQPSTPLNISIRSDFVEAFQIAMQGLHDQGCMLPLVTPIGNLPKASPGATPPSDPLPYIGRVLGIIPTAALADPATDPVVLARPQGTTDPFEIVARVISPGTVAVPPANWDSLQCDATSCTPNAVNNAEYVPVAPVLASAGFYPASPLPEPTNATSSAWSRFTNITGLVSGVTKLGDELSLLYSSADIAASVFAGRLHWTWNGTEFSASP